MGKRLVNKGKGKADVGGRASLDIERLMKGVDPTLQHVRSTVKPEGPDLRHAGWSKEWRDLFTAIYDPAATGNTWEQIEKALFTNKQRIYDIALHGAQPRTSEIFMLRGICQTLGVKPPL